MQEIIYTYTMTNSNLDNNALKQSLKNIASNLYNQNFDVIGSYGKAPRLHKWQGVDRDVLFKQAMLDFDNEKANSINLRMTSSDLIALDFDIPNDAVTSLLIKKIRLFNVFKDFKTVYTCRAKKGLKIFCRYKGNKKLLPNTIGLKVNHLDSTYEFEIKKYVATIAGLYSDNNILYSQYASNLLSTNYIGNASYDDIDFINDNQLEMIKNIYHMTLAELGIINVNDYKEQDFKRPDLQIIKTTLYLLKFGTGNINLRSLIDICSLNDNYFLIQAMEFFIDENINSDLKEDKELMNIIKNLEYKNEKEFLKNLHIFSDFFINVHKEILNKLKNLQGSARALNDVDIFNSYMDYELELAKQEADKRLESYFDENGLLKNEFATDNESTFDTIKES